MEPNAADVAAVSQALGEQPGQPQFQPQPQAQPAQPTYQPGISTPQPQQQPAPVTSQPQAQPQAQPPADPFSFFSTPTEPGTQPAQQPAQAQPTEPLPNQQPQQPVEPVAQPAPQPQAQPGQIEQQSQQPQPQAQPQAQAPTQQTYEQYMESVLAGVPQAPAQPDPSTVNPDDPEAIKGFFDTLMTTAEQRFEANYARKQAIQNSEKRLWDDAFGQYESLRTNTQLRDMVHAIRMGEFNKGIAITPTQAAERLLVALRGQYQQGVADNQVVTTYEQVQPNGGGSTAVPTTMDTDKALLAVQTGGEEALAQVLEQSFRSQGQ